MDYKPSKYQEAIYDFVENGSGNGVVNAVAGSGKTYTLIQCAKRIPSDKEILICAFNRSIKEELTKKTENIPNVTVGTFHSLGYKILRENGIITGKLTPNGRKYYSHIKQTYTILPQKIIDTIEIDGEGMTDEEYALAMMDEQKKALTEYQNTILALVNFGRCYLCKDKAGLGRVARRYQIECKGDEKKRALEVMEWSKGYTWDLDYGDLVWYPNALNLSPSKTYDWILVDECQDLNSEERELVLKFKGSNTRMICFGDPNQAIYSFSGADINSFRKLQRSPHTKSLPLSITYRCPKNVVEFVKKTLGKKDFYWNTEREDDGEVKVECLLKDVQDSDMILCKNNAPLAGIYIRLIKDGRNARILGKDAFKSLLKMIDNSKETDLEIEMSRKGVISFAYDKLFQVVYRYQKKYDIPTCEAIESDEVSSLLDRIKTLEILSEGLKTAQELKDLIDSIPSDGDGIILSTIHKAKGLEAPNVYCAGMELFDNRHTFWYPDWQKKQDENLKYVMFTRPKNNLCFLAKTEYDVDDDYGEDFKWYKVRWDRVNDLYGRKRSWRYKED